jgi:TRAP-type C4-dicarboxylate transport system permease small subunit
MKTGRRLYTILDGLRRYAIVVFFSFIIITCFIEVCCRYIFGWSLGWTEEMLRSINVWVIMLGASIAAKRDTHFRVTLFLKYFRPEYRERITQLVYIILFVFLGVLIFFGTKKMLRNIPLGMLAVPGLSIAWFYLAIPVGSICIFLEYFLRFIYKKHPFEGPDERGSEL